MARLLPIAGSVAERAADRIRAIRLLCENKALTSDQAVDALMRLLDDPHLDDRDRARAVAHDADAVRRDLLRRAMATRDRAMLGALIERRGVDPSRDAELAGLCSDGELADWLEPATVAAKRIGMHLDRSIWLPLARSIAARIGTGANAHDSAWSTRHGENPDLLAWLRASARYHPEDVVDLLADVAVDAGRGLHIRTGTLAVMLELGSRGRNRVLNLIPSVLSGPGAPAEARVRFATYLCKYGLAV